MTALQIFEANTCVPSKPLIKISLGPSTHWRDPLTSCYLCALSLEGVQSINISLKTQYPKMKTITQTVSKHNRAKPLPH